MEEVGSAAIATCSSNNTTNSLIHTQDLEYASSDRTEFRRLCSVKSLPPAIVLPLSDVRDFIYQERLAGRYIMRARRYE